MASSSVVMHNTRFQHLIGGETRPEWLSLVLLCIVKEISASLVVKQGQDGFLLCCYALYITTLEEAILALFHHQ